MVELAKQGDIRLMQNISGLSIAWKSVGSKMRPCVPQMLQVASETELCTNNDNTLILFGRIRSVDGT